MIKSQIVSILDKYSVIALAVSGGSDSMAMAEWFRINRPKNSYVILNIDHQIRGEESERDSDFVNNYANKYGIKIYRYKVDAIAFAKENGYTEEQSARILRHRIFEQVALEHANVVATAHHISDQAESIFMHIARGCGVDGLCGMAVEDGHIIRPLLNTTKDEIMQFIKANNIEYCDDSTNNNNDYSRNYTRNVVFPSIKEKYPTFDKSLIKLSERAREIADFVDQNTPSLALEDGGVYCDLKGKHKVIQTEMLRRAFSLLGVTADIEERHIQSILSFVQTSANGSLDMPYNTIVYKERDGVVICKNTTFSNETYRFSEGFFEIGGYELQVQKVKNISFCDIENSKVKSNNIFANSLYIAIDNTEELYIRLRKKGDKIEKFGGGSKSLGDFLTDKKVPLRLRDRLPIVASGNNVVCVCGVEISASVKVTNDSKDIYKITLNCLS